jgi:hypothetical protein
MRPSKALKKDGTQKCSRPSNSYVQSNRRMWRRSRIGITSFEMKPPTVDVSKATFGQITSASVNPRLIRFALKFAF